MAKSSPKKSTAKSSAPPASTLPTYIERGGEQSLVPPGTLNSTQFYIFVLKADKTKLQAMADRLFNTPSGGAVDYRAFSDYVALMFTHVDELYSAQPSQGWINYHDIALWVPYVAVKKHLGVEVADRIVMYPPYLMVDSGATMVTGREVFGLPKEWGWFTMPQDPNYAGDFTADVLGYSAASATKQNIQTRLWSVERQSSTLPVPHQPLKSLEEVFNAIKGILSSASPNLRNDFIIPNIPNILKELITGIPALGLKQFRDAAQVTQACYQAIIEAPLKNVGFRGARLYADPFTFTLNDLASHPVAADTGLRVGPQPVVLSLYLHLDMQMSPGTIQWQANTGG